MCANIKEGEKTIGEILENLSEEAELEEFEERVNRSQIMKPFSFIHTADLHLDSPFKGISEVSGEISLELTEATFKAFNKIINLCIEKQVNFLLIAGDIYNGTDRSLRAQLRFRDGLKRLSEAGIKAYIVHGNHDPLDGWSANLDWPKNVHIFGRKPVERVPVEKDGEEIAQIYGISFHTREIKTNLTYKFPKISPSKKALFTIGMLHCNVGSNTGHESYAPCTLQDLISRNFDYWALGHVHKKAIINDDNPLVIYPGNPQGLHPKETGARGCFLINVNENGEPTAEFIEVDSIRWFVEELSIDSLYTEQELISQIHNCIEKIREEAEGRSSVCRIILTGRSALHSSIARKGVLDDILKDTREDEEGEKQFVWIESIGDNTNPEIDRKSLLEREDFIGDLVKLFEEFSHNETKIAELKESLEPLFTSPGGRKLLEPIDDEYFLDLIKKAETLCLDKLVGGEIS
ncbi:MAG: DNA repair exonuclease [Methanophagales archaeon]|nr:DNA repair exonuclease [Methanophagales archaeon]